MATLTIDASRMKDRARFDAPAAEDARQAGHGWTKAAIAELSPAAISRMSNRELAQVIRASHTGVLRPDVDRRLEYYDRQTLERLVYLARRCCRHQGY